MSLRSRHGWGWAAVFGLALGAAARAGDADTGAWPAAVYACAAWETPPASLLRTQTRPRTFLAGTPMAFEARAGLVDEWLDMDRDFDRVLPLLAPDKPVYALFGVFADDDGESEDAEGLVVTFAPATAGRLGAQPAVLDPARALRWRPDGAEGVGRFVWSEADGDEEDLRVVRLAPDRWLVTDADRRETAAMAEALRRWTPPAAWFDGAAGAADRGRRIRLLAEPAKAIALLGREADDEVEDWWEEAAKHATAALPAGYAAALENAAGEPGPAPATKPEKVAEARRVLEQIKSWSLAWTATADGEAAAVEQWTAIDGSAFDRFLKNPPR